MASRVKRFRLSSSSSSSVRNPHEISRDSASSDPAQPSEAPRRSAQGYHRIAAQTEEEQEEEKLPQRRRPLARAVTNPASSRERRSPFKLTPPQQQLTYAAVQAFALTFLVLFFSSWIALASAVASTSGPQLATTVVEAGPTASIPLPGYAADENDVAELSDTAAQAELFNTSSAFLEAISGLNANATARLGTHLGTTKPPPVSPSGGAFRTVKGPQFTGLSTTAAFVAASNALESVTAAASDNDSTAGAAGREFDGSESPTGEFVVPPVHAIVVTIVLLFVILGTVVGNVLVCIAVCMVRKLRRPCNYLLVSLALSDLCVAVLVMPMALLYEVLEKWNFGTLLCDIWVSFDVLCCTASILNLCAISVDRYLAITKPLEYGVKRTPRRMMLCVALVWLAAACISLPPLLILGNEHFDENGDPICAVCQNFAYQIYATLGSFYIPLSVMLFVYYQIFRAARRIVLEEKRAQTHLQHALNGTGQTAAPPATTHTELGSGNGQRHSSFGNTSLSYSTCGGLSAGHAAGGSGSSGLLGSPHHKKLRFQLAKEKKASTTLGIIMSAFTICWLPFFILALIRPFVESETTHVPQSLSSLFLWLGYANSLLNPIIYATLNRDFRKPFQEILYFRCSSLNTMMRENYYQDQYGEPPSQRVMLGDERHGARESFL